MGRPTGAELLADVTATPSATCSSARKTRACTTWWQAVR